jgi:hypothetical protein
MEEQMEWQLSIHVLGKLAPLPPLAAFSHPCLSLILQHSSSQLLPAVVPNSPVHIKNVTA